MAYKPYVLDNIDIKKFRECDFKVYNGLMTVTEMCKELGISYPTLMKYRNELVMRTAMYNAMNGKDDLLELLNTERRR